MSTLPESKQNNLIMLTFNGIILPEHIGDEESDKEQEETHSN